MEKQKENKASLWEEEEDSEFLTLSLYSSLSSHSEPNPTAATPLTLSLQSTPLPPPLSSPLYTQAIPFTSSFSSFSSNPNNNNIPYSFPTQTVPYPFTVFSSPPPHTHFPVSWPPPTTQNPRKRARATQNPNNHHGPRHGMNNKSETVTPPFPWATNRRAIIYSLRSLMEAPEVIRTITGTVHCKACEKSYKIGFDLEAKFAEVSRFIVANANKMSNMAPEVWKSPKLPTCVMCKNSVIRPVIMKKRRINWLFLFLGQMLGCCTLAQLKYYCKHTKCFRTGSKDRILYFTYIGICEQLVPGFTSDLFDNP